MPAAISANTASLRLTRWSRLRVSASWRRRVARRSRSERVVVVLGGAADDVREQVDLTGVEVVENDEFGEGCSTSVRAGLGALPADTAEGDVILVADAGAYGMAMANTYNLRALPAEEAIE